ncbi:glycosyltransferase family 2 protein [Pinirhizobacter soli]|uniref:glycosyltransferase family 2 protein n=1 Tax=Pinirhizobacter soli TaxID=2786953 RepID=UPI00202A7C26|nr:glycosyltransferase family 2 protein [Pinirhizobacter soli]
MSDKISHRPTSSITVCTYNGAAHIAEQLDSLLAQSCLPEQIVIADDASTDGTATLVENFVPRAQALGIAVEFIRHPVNVGFVANFSHALGHASGEVVFLCDQDDVWHLDKLATMLAAFGKRPELTLLHADARLVDDNLVDLGASLFQALRLTRGELDLVHAGRAFDVLIRRSAATGATLALRRELIDVALPVPEGWIHDEWLAMIASIVGVVDVLERPVIDYRQHGGNQIGARPRTLADRWNDLVRPRGAMFMKEVARMQALERWLVQREDATGARSMVTRRIAHFQARLAMDLRRHVGRLPAIAQQWREGNYALFSNGRRSILRDLMRRA